MEVFMSDDQVVSIVVALTALAGYGAYKPGQGRE